MGLWIGVGGLVVFLVATVVQWKTRRKWVDRVMSALMLLGWVTVVQFLLKPLVPSQVMVAVMLGGITVGIFAAAVIGRRQADRAEADRQRRAGAGEAVTPPGAA
ncbi:hypothetical protein L6E12_09680 [Actinokineospora sp. PR83]|uniref:hypothetical protein n=1 Tax=Actinokineospora sp. PR83 TaxID=2884908 RepID=UPI001F378B7B|nr:hypothetical protein [Actinokineospora sp. PR83]MCG8916059.1 hypothetical protein [Actinokineospora sp. PR83]